MNQYIQVVTRVLFVALLTTATAAIGQQSVTGLVTSSDDGSPMPGVNILERGTTNGTVTNADGTYSIAVSPSATLIFTFVGYTTQEVAVGNRSAINVALAPDVLALSEVIVIGYGKQEKGDVTGVIAAVDAKNFNRGAIVSPDQLITGKIAGVQITSNNGGEPGGQSSIRIRGGTSINANNEPLYVIDGVPIDNGAFNPGGFSAGRNPLNFLNPSDIESFTVLKDASATAIYGSRGANGVIIITTKKGSKGAGMEINYEGWYSVGQIVQKPSLMSGAEFRQVVEERAPSRADLLMNENTNWFDQILQRATGKSHTLSASGGTDNGSYRISFNHQDQDGVVKTSNTQRTNFSLSYSHAAFDKKLQLNLNVKGANTKDRFPSGGAIGNAYNFAPTQPILDANSRFAGYYEWDNFQATQNPVALINLTNDVSESNRSIGNLQADYDLSDLVDGLHANVNVGYDIMNIQRKRFLPNNMKAQAIDSGEVRLAYTFRKNLLFEGYLNYKKQIINENHVLDVMAGYSYQDFASENPSLRAWTLPFNFYGYNNTSIAENTQSINNVQENRLISFFGRVNYSLKNRYLLTATLRRDGSSRFGLSNRWGLFPSAALAWRILDEPFMQPATQVLSDLKLRVGYGITGNQEIGNYQYLSTYTFGDNRANAQFGNEYVATLRPNGVDPDLRWEQTASLNIGLDFGLFKGRVNGSIEYYSKTTSDLLFNVTVPAGSNYTNVILTNIGKIKNEGVEVNVNASIVEKTTYSWNVGLNLSRNKNKVLALDGNDDPQFAGYEITGINGGTGNRIQILRVGQPVNAFYTFKQVYGSDGNPLVDGVDHNEDGVIDYADRYADTNGDGEVREDDRRPYKKPAPDWLIGFSSQFTYKRFDLNFTMRANLGNYVYNNVVSSTAFYDRVISGVVPQNMPSAVRETNFVAPQFFTDYYVEDASFVRMDNITLGYNPNTLFKKVKMRVYATVQNPFVITNYSGLDPEVNNGVDNNIFPRSRTYLFGVNIGL